MQVTPLSPMFRRSHGAQSSAVVLCSLLEIESIAQGHPQSLEGIGFSWDRGVLIKKAGSGDRVLL